MPRQSKSDKISAIKEDKKQRLSTLKSQKSKETTNVSKSQETLKLQKGCVDNKDIVYATKTTKRSSVQNTDCYCDLSDYYTKSEVNKLINNNEVNLSNYYTKNEANRLIGSNNPDLTNYYTKSEVNKLVNTIQFGIENVNLSNYYTKSEVDNLIKNEKTQRDNSVKSIYEAISKLEANQNKEPDIDIWLYEKIADFCDNVNEILKNFNLEYSK